MSYIERTEEYKGYNIKIVSDEDPANPRTDWDGAATMCCWHSRYNLGDWRNGKVLSKYYSEPIDLLYELAGLDRDSEQELREGAYISNEELYRLIEERGTIISPLYLYDHSGITISMGGFSCPWDSGQIGWVYMEKDKIDEEFDGDKDRAWKCMEGEVETYDDFLTGEVYGYDIETIDGESTGESCWGYFGDPDKSGCLDDARSAVDRLAADAQEQYEKLPKKHAAEMYMI